jgi:hypothetical protein
MQIAYINSTLSHPKNRFSGTFAISWLWRSLFLTGQVSKSEMRNKIPYRVVASFGVIELLRQLEEFELR